ncbi:alpha/beta fold hydrolase [Palleronia pelagia]|uniref:Pimeloyl-ACP methyl ester carboxylesterase n=1 Tax=Palleronia pelagia TaxID=387096 RepID=A0A1H8CWB8_9RHOB|nr:alpha/beta fold hydrolase [Palleronia pelagia]SEM98467.1 Pimeloyl-ACP methyl ester carboxylesterase [Palleronia pelagia]
MSELLLIHGSCHGAWCWRDTLAELQALGQPARAIDLPGHGADRTPPADVTLDTYAARIVEAIDTPVTLVGHSMGGFPITAAALAAPDKIARLVYLCAYVPTPGRSLSQMRGDWPDQPLVPHIRRAEDGASFTFDPDRVETLFYHDCPPGTVEFARAHLTPQPTAPQATALPRLPDVPRSYIVCDDDRAIPAGFQRQMAADFPDGEVQTMATAHSPFFAAPGDLARRLAALAGRAD